MSRKEKEPELLNIIRQWLGLTPIIPKKVKCLKCNKTFVNLGAHHRLCDECHKLRREGMRNGRL